MSGRRANPFGSVARHPQTTIHHQLDEKALIVREPSGPERVVPLDQDVVTIGRDPSCTIRLHSPYVSRLHARIEVHAGASVLVDLGSRNGALLNGTRVHGTVELGDGDEIGIADFTIQYRATPAGEATTQTYDRPEQAPATVADVLRVDDRLFEVWLGDHPPPRRLSAQEFQLLQYLYAHRDRVCLRRELGDAVWGADRWDLNMLHRLVHRSHSRLQSVGELSVR